MKLHIGQTKEETPPDLHGLYDLLTITKSAITHEFHRINIGFLSESDDTKPYGWIIHLEPVMYEGTFMAEVQYPSSEVYGISLPDNTQEILKWIESHPKEGLPGAQVDLDLLETVKLGWSYERKLFDDRNRFPDLTVMHSHRITALNFFYNDPSHPEYRENEGSELNTAYTFFAESDSLRDYAMHEAEHITRAEAEARIWKPAPWFTGMTSLQYNEDYE